MQITAIRHAYPEKAGFFVERQRGHEQYTFLHFYNSVELCTQGRRIMTAPHALILYSPKMPQYYKSAEPLLHDWMHFTGDVSDLLKESGWQPDTVYYPPRSEFITEQMAAMEAEHLDGREGAARILDLKAQELFLKIGRSLSEGEREAVSRETVQKFRQLRGEVFSSLDERWTVSDMAGRVHLSPSRFFAVYKAVFGISPTEDLIEVRINTAKNRLLYEDNAIDDLADALGYQNTTHFIRQFKKRVGVSPAKYRREHRS